jgi:hypothetical protein
VSLLRLTTSYYIFFLNRKKQEDVIRSRKCTERHYNGQKKEDVVRSRKSKERHYNGQKKEDVIRSRQSTERHYNGQKKEDVISVMSISRQLFQWTNPI